MSDREWEQLPALVTADELAARYQISRRTLNDRYRAGKLPRPVDPDAHSKQWHPDVISGFEAGTIAPWTPGDLDAPSGLRSVS
jgi:hypothetical protein